MPMLEEDKSSATQTITAANGEIGKQHCNNYKPPEFVIHYPVKINCHGDKISKSTYDWLQEHGVQTIYPPKAYQKLVDADFPALSSRVYVDAEPNGLEWASKFLTWLFAMDDKMDETEMAISPGASMPLLLELSLVLMWSFPEDPVLQENATRFLDALPSSELQKQAREFITDKLREAKDTPAPRVYNGKLGPLSSCLRSMWETSMQTMPEVYNLRMAKSIQDYFVGNLMETAVRQSGIIPSIEEYIILRRKTGAVFPCLLAVDLISEVHLPSELYDSDPMQRMLDAINDIVCWHNDVWSLKKEMAHGYVHNLVILISQEQNISSYQEAALIARQMVYDRIVDLEQAFADLLAIASTSKTDDHVVRAYIKACQHWISGAQTWNITSSRYK